jgi:hypothetical protein
MFGTGSSSDNILTSFHRVSEVNMLDREAKEMERNLKNLQERMLQQNIEDEATPKYGGSRWKSARPDKGSVTSYAKDIQEKHRKKSNTEDPGLKSHLAPRLTSQKEKVPLDFRSKGRTPDKEPIMYIIITSSIVLQF